MECIIYSGSAKQFQTFFSVIITRNLKYKSLLITVSIRYAVISYFFVLKETDTVQIFCIPSVNCFTHFVNFPFVSLSFVSVYLVDAGIKTVGDSIHRR